MNQRGEIARYAEIAEPEIGLVLNVGPAHIGMLGSLDAIGDAKGELFFGLHKREGIAIVNGDDPQVKRTAAASGVERRRTFGRGEGLDVRLLAYQPTDAGGRARFQIDGNPLEVDLAIAGEHNAINAAGAIAMVTASTPRIAPASFEAIAAGLSAAVQVGRRMVFESIGPFLVVDDCYNANSASMLAAIETVRGKIAARGGRFVAVLGEMRELGSFSDHEHERVGRALVEAGVALAGVFGPLAAPLAACARAGGIETMHQAEDASALFDWLLARLAPGDVVLVKGSRGAKMERFIERLRKEPG
jgi:UDP-N-acetylmuramoyl-tripeptide--D-alanyl-D-alanine ligase